MSSDTVESDEAHDAPPPPPAMQVESSVYQVTLPSAPVRVGWNRHVDPYDANRETEGIIAMFDSGDAALDFAAARNAAWVDGAVRTIYFPQGGKFCCWVDTTLVPVLEALKCPLPHLELAGNQLALSFAAVPLDAPANCGAPILAGGPVEGTVKPIWHIPLVNKATRADVQLLADQLSANAAGG